ncbi:unnamed protein product [Anisakis simplex]|uniref:Peptidase M12B domain-containing protein n=1 Tax=Anisakis simplex TaxID=6269 RepID=A0A0M3K1A8_ANISI|nr:unnamed protein product [Anisakis simplex]
MAEWSKAPDLSDNTLRVLDKFAAEESSIELVSGRHRRESAVWGEPAPDYSGVVLDGMTRYVHALLFVDSKITRHYNFDMPNIKKEVLKMIKEANDYFYQINLRVIVVDVLQTQRSDLSLYSFEDYRNTRMDRLPRHDFAALISYRYAGGLAFVGGMCTAKAVMLCGVEHNLSVGNNGKQSRAKLTETVQRVEQNRKFYPHHPTAMGSIFFHEVAHLIGVPHRNANETIDVPNCHCNQMHPNEKPSGPAGCLKIPGYDHDCTLQQMANLLYKNRCLRSRKSSIFDQILVEKSLPICGNGVKEQDEECDCGIERYCFNLNCRSETCTQIVKTWQMYLGLIVISALLFTTITVYIYYRFIQSCSTSIPSMHLPKRSCPKFVSELPHSKYIRCLRKLLPCCSHRNYPNYTNSMRRAGNSLSSSHLIAQKSKLDANSIVVLIDPCDSERLVRKPTFSRPKNPPPPPPIGKLKSAPATPTTESAKVEATSKSNDTRLTKKPPPPPLPSKPPKSLSSIIADANPDQDVYEVPNSVRMRTSLSNEPLELSSIRHTQVSTTNYDSISRKFDDFDEESDGDYDDRAEADQTNAIQYTKILSRNERLNPNSDQQHQTQQERTGANVSQEPAREFARVKREESFSSNDSSELRQCVSDDTGSTGLSEEDDRPNSISQVVKRFNQTNSNA